ncbi:MAG: winged helix-turn-helix transcriptional regulator [Clostridiaceae bacterium]|nr:winged helix-turn-helix transcriptional regulator [Clostridiaceae bacterium]
MKKTEEQIELYTKFFHGLSNPTRYNIILALIDKEKSVGELVEELGYSQSLISMQLKCLKWCNFVTSIKEGKNIYYSIADERIVSLLQLGEIIAEGNTEQICTCSVIQVERSKMEKDVEIVEKGVANCCCEDC